MDVLNERVGLFWVGKTILVGLGAVLLSTYRNRSIAQWGLIISLLAYGIIALEHLRISTLMIWHFNHVPEYISSGLANL